MNKKVIIFSAMILLLCIGFIVVHYVYSEGDEEDTTTYKYLKETDLYKKINIDEVSQLTITKYTEGGALLEEITDIEEIESTYNSLGNIRLGKKTDMACEDNTTIYLFQESDEKKTAIEIECDWIIIGKDRYLINK